MIYEGVRRDTVIRQGDIFRDIPRVDFSFEQVVLVESDDPRPRVLSWHELLSESPEEVNALLPVTAVCAVVITQDCDAQRSEFISLCQVVPYINPDADASSPKSPAKWASYIARHSRDRLRYFYLPADEEIGFTGRMAADFGLVFSIRRAGLENMRYLRPGRLNDVAYQHFRESLGQFFRRYPYNEWYPFTKEEFQAYSEKCPEPVEPYPWQK